MGTKKPGVINIITIVCNGDYTRVYISQNFLKKETLTFPKVPTNY